MEVILDDLASKSRVLYEEGKFKEVEEMFNTFIKESGQFKACDGLGCAISPLVHCEGSRNLLACSPPISTHFLF